jgi:hypothetical protein
VAGPRLSPAAAQGQERDGVGLGCSRWYRSEASDRDVADSGSASSRGTPPGRFQSSAPRRRWHWSPYGSQDHPGSLRAEDLVERTDELGIPIADEEPDGGRAIIELWRSRAPRQRPIRHTKRLERVDSGRSDRAQVQPPGAEALSHTPCRMRTLAPAGVDCLAATKRSQYSYLFDRGERSLANAIRVKVRGSAVSQSWRVELGLRFPPDGACCQGRS